MSPVTLAAVFLDGWKVTAIALVCLGIALTVVSLKAWRADR